MRKTFQLLPICSMLDLKFEFVHMCVNKPNIIMHNLVNCFHNFQICASVFSGTSFLWEFYCIQINLLFTCLVYVFQLRTVEYENAK